MVDNITPGENGTNLPETQPTAAIQEEPQLLEDWESDISGGDQEPDSMLNFHKGQ